MTLVKLAFISSHLQLALGLLLWWSQGYLSQLSQDTQSVMSDKALRILAVEHPVTNILAIALITIGFISIKKICHRSDETSQRYCLLWHCTFTYLVSYSISFMAKSIDTKLRTILDNVQLEYILHRLAHQLIEVHGGFKDSILLGVQPRGITLCSIIHQLIEYKLKSKIYHGSIDISMHRDDIHLQGTNLSIGKTEIPISLDNKNIVLIDDVLYTGRTIKSCFRHPYGLW